MEEHKLSKYRLRRQDTKRKMVFFGWEIAKVVRGTSDPDKWDKVRVFIKDHGPYIVGIVHYTDYDEENDSYVTHKCKTKSKVLAWVRRESPALLSDIERQLETYPQVNQWGPNGRDPQIKERQDNEQVKHSN